MTGDSVRLEVSVGVGEVAVVGVYGDMLAEEHGVELADIFSYSKKFILGSHVAALGGI